MKKSAVLIMILVCALMLCGCGCKHEWNEAACESPRTCANCDATEGEALGHDWLEATCDSPKTCARCELSEGEALGHDWSDASCESPRTCTRCGLGEGEALGHDWLITSCTEPRSCTRCELTEDAPAGHSFGKWAAEGEKMSRECSVCGETEETDFDEDIYVKSLLQGIRSFDYSLDFDTINAGFGTAVLPHTLGDNNPGTYIDFDDEGSGIIYKVKPNPAVSDIFATNAYIFEAIPVSVESISRDEVVAKYNVESYDMEFVADDNSRLPVALTKESLTSGDYTVSVTFEADSLEVSFDEHSHERLVFTGTWSNDNQDTVNFADDGSFTASIMGKEYEGVWLTRPARKNDGVSTIRVMLCYELEGVLHTQYAVTDVPNEKGEAFYDIAESIDVSALELTVRFGNNEATLTKNT